MKKKNFNENHTINTRLQKKNINWKIEIYKTKILEKFFLEILKLHKQLIK